MAPGWRCSRWSSGLSFPLYLTAPPGDLARLFMVEKTGAIRISRTALFCRTHFWISSPQVSYGSEQGLLGLAFDPDYATTGRFVVHYTDLGGNTRSFVSGFRRSRHRRPASEQVILTATQPFANHNGGQLLSGPTACCTSAWATGLGRRSRRPGPGSDRPARLHSPGGRPTRHFLHLCRRTIRSWASRTPGRRSGATGCAIPGASASTGLTGDLYIADVGQSQSRKSTSRPRRRQAAKACNYGWNIMEGQHCFTTRPVQPDRPDPSGARVRPRRRLLDHRRLRLPRRGHSALQGLYFFADFCRGWVRSFRYAGGAVATELTDWPTLRTRRLDHQLRRGRRRRAVRARPGGRVFKIVPEP